MIRSLLILCAVSTFLLLAPMASAQPTIVEPEDSPTQLPLVDSNSDNADHVIVAVNDLGDMLIVWDEETTAGSPPVATVQASAIFIPTKKVSGVQSWQVPTTAELIGDPEEGNSGDIVKCEKPHVTAVGDNFIIAYPRIQTTGSKLTRIETIGVEVTDNGSSSYNTATFHYDTTDGVGYVVSTEEGFTNDWFQGGSSGNNLGLCHFTDGLLPDEDGAAIVFLEQPSTEGVYDLYSIYVDYDENGIDGEPEVTECDSGPNAEWLLSGIRSEENHSMYNQSRRVAPRIIEDVNGYLVLAYGEWEESGASQGGRIMLRSYSFSGPSCLVLEDTMELQNSTNTSWHHRRPVFGKTKNSSDNMSLGWANFDDDHGGTPAAPVIDWMEFHIDSNGDLVDDGDYNLGSLSNVAHARPVFAKNGSGSTDTFEVVIYNTVNSVTTDHVKYWDETTSTQIDDSTGTGDHATRPAYAVWEKDPDYFMVVVYDQLVSAESRPYFVVMDITD
ncbi:MAG: hypothetical protein DWQ01_00445 [Planctomycetota bacterium]|nr:MAG: hypothetical protein DWQ01_00445 [Planctomycetota bacterium]